MARPHKNGLDYFPFDTKPDMKMNAVIRKYGATGLGCLIGLYQKIYDNGYFIKADFDFIEDLCLELRIDDEDYLKEFIKFCIKKKLFDADLYKSKKILTSTGVQKRFNEATKRRKCKHDVNKYFINVDNNSINVDNNSINADNSTQREIERESKEKYKEEFEKFRVLYKGTKNGLNKEFENFIKKNPDFKEIIPKLIPAINSQEQSRQLLISTGAFCPPWKNLSTWINQSCWEMEIASPESIKQPQPKRDILAGVKLK